MLGFIFMIGLVWLIFSLIKLAWKAAWSISKIIFSIVLFPLTLVWMAFSGMIFLSIGLAIVGIIISKLS
ncbi:MAG: hypothetical protein KBT48_05240 [Firmicutes bacterium]|nr:hypothetical protein [Bacillota bacterium]